MPGYLFNIIDNSRTAAPVRVDVSDLATARREALRTACLSINENSDRFWSDGDWEMIVTDDRGLMLFSLHMHAAESPAAKGRGYPG